MEDEVILAVGKVIRAETTTQPKTHEYKYIPAMEKWHKESFRNKFVLAVDIRNNQREVAKTTATREQTPIYSLPNSTRNETRPSIMKTHHRNHKRLNKMEKRLVSQLQQTWSPISH